MDLPLHLASTTGRRKGVWEIERENLSLPVKVFNSVIATVTTAYCVEFHLIGFF